MSSIILSGINYKFIKKNIDNQGHFVQNLSRFMVIIIPSDNLMSLDKIWCITLCCSNALSVTYG